MSSTTALYPLDRGAGAAPVDRTAGGGSWSSPSLSLSESQPNGSLAACWTACHLDPREEDPRGLNLEEERSNIEKKKKN